MGRSRQVSVVGVFVTLMVSVVLAGRVVPSTAAAVSSPVPLDQVRRIEAQCYYEYVYVPSWVPPGYHFSNWQVFGWNVPCDRGFAVRFRRGSRRLTWQTGGRQTANLACNNKRTAVAHVGRHIVYRRVSDGLEKVWICLGNRSYPEPLVVFQSTGKGHRAGVADLVRILAGAHRVPAARASVGAYQLPSSADVRHLAARFARPLYLPAELPDGFIFSAWTYRAHDPNTRRDSLYVTFGNDGGVILWRVDAGRDTFRFECPTDKTPFAPKIFTVIDGIPIFRIVGIHGGSIWRCIPADAVGNKQPLEVSAWYSIGLDSPAFERELAEIVADANLIT